MVAPKHILRSVVAFVPVCCANAQPVPLPAAPAGVTVTTDHGIEFSTIDPRNAPAISEADVRLGSYMFGRGSGLSPFRMSRTEITNAQWQEFANTFIPGGDPFRLAVRYNLSVGVAMDAQGQPIALTTDESLPFPGSRMAATGISYLNAARFCNWLTNGRQATIESTMTGSYDLTGITDHNPNSDTITRSAGALYWIPSVDEWAAAAYYQPGANGQAGHWNQYPISSSSLPTSGLPGQPGAQTSAGIGAAAMLDFFGVGVTPVALYPNAQSPWGLFDMSGGVAEMTGTTAGEGSPYVIQMGSGWNSEGIWVVRDRLGFPDAFNGFATGLVGLRIAAAVPAPGPSAALLTFVCSGLFFRRRHR